jgi:hypothetical protein
VKTNLVVFDGLRRANVKPTRLVGKRTSDDIDEFSRCNPA